MMLKNGMVGYLDSSDEERIIVWGCDPCSDRFGSPDVTPMITEIKRFVPKFLVKFADTDSLGYMFEGGKEIHLFNFDEDCFCYSFKTKKLTKASKQLVYEEFYKAF